MFKFVVLCALIAAASAVNKYGGSIYGGHNVPSSDDASAEIKSYSSDVRADGYQYAFDTTNGIAASASGNVYGDAQGDFGWVSPEGVHVAVQYVADENGYQPRGDVLPTPHPIPAAILRSLEYIRTHAAQEEHHSNGRRF